MGPLFASVFIWDAESREYLRGFVNSDIIRAVRAEMESVTGIIAGRLRIAHERWQSLLRAAGGAEAQRRGELTLEANSLRAELKKWVNQSKDGIAQETGVCMDSNLVTDWDETVREIGVVDPGNI